jgi:hypothetical protein
MRSVDMPHSRTSNVRGEEKSTIVGRNSGVELDLNMFNKTLGTYSRKGTTYHTVMKVYVL